jgi:hypothetical protein
MSRDIDPAIRRYFERANSFDAEGASAAFAPDAVVHDENRDHVGTDAIRDWLRDTMKRYSTQLQPESVTPAGNATIVLTRVSGTFPGSPIALRFSFQLANGLIARLEIAA